MNTKRQGSIVGLSVGQRLTLGVAPALLAVLLVVGLAYYGERGRAIPSLVLVGAAALAVVSLVLTWLNTQYLARRIRRLAGGVDVGHASELLTENDEIGRIEIVVKKLGSALSAAEDARRDVIAQSEATFNQLATTLAAAVRDARAQLDELRLPLHILMDAPFGDLNENQEELLVDARAAGAVMDVTLRRLTQIADANRGALPVLLERVAVNDVLRAVLPMLRAAAERQGARMDTDFDPRLPRVAADRARLAEAIALIGIDAAAMTTDLRALTLKSSVDTTHVRIFMSPPPAVESYTNVAFVLAEQLIVAQHGLLTVLPHAVEIILPLDGMRA